VDIVQRTGLSRASEKNLKVMQRRGLLKASLDKSGDEKRGLIRL
jgi:hypothetical protein